MQTTLDFLSALVLKDHSKWKANKNKHGEGDNAYPNVRSKINNKKNKKINASWNPSLQKNCVNDHSSVQRNKIMDSSELMAAKFFISSFQFFIPLSSLTFVL